MDTAIRPRATADLEGLKNKLEHVEDLVTPPLSEEQRRGEGPTKASRGERRLTWYCGIEDAVLDLSSAMPEGVQDYDARKLLEVMVQLRRLLDADPEVRDPKGEIELATMRMADTVRRIHERLQRAQLDDPQGAAAYVFERLDGLSAAELARLLGVSARTVAAWRQGSAVRQNAVRVALVAQLTADLRGSMTSRGVALWFEASRAQLDGRSPLQVLDEGDKQAQLELLELASGSRAQLAD